MSLKDIKNKNQGFTIVELLIVVVVIAILAAITIVSYNGITNRANASASKSLASTWQKKVELYNSEEGRYPIDTDEMDASTSDSWYLDTASYKATAPDNSDGKTQVLVQRCKTTGTGAVDASNITGIRITYYDFEAKTTANLDAGNLGGSPVCVALGS